MSLASESTISVFSDCDPIGDVLFTHHVTNDTDEIEATSRIPSLDVTTGQLIDDDEERYLLSYFKVTEYTFFIL